MNGKLEDLNIGTPLLPGDPKGRAHSRLWSDHVCIITQISLRKDLHDLQVNRNITPAFYRYLQAQEVDQQINLATELRAEIAKLVDAAHPQGPFFLGTDISFVDIQFAPWIIRMSRVLTPYRGWPQPENGSRWASWVDAIERNEGVKATTSTDDLYLDSYERYAGKLLISCNRFVV